MRIHLSTFLIFFRTGRPQFDDEGVAVIFVHDVKKDFYKKFMHEPFPVESSLHTQLANHFNAEIVAGTITSKQVRHAVLPRYLPLCVGRDAISYHPFFRTQEAMEYLTWTYFYRRLVMNPTFYNLEDSSPDGINLYLSEMVRGCCSDAQPLVLAPLYASVSSLTLSSIITTHTG